MTADGHLKDLRSNLERFIGEQIEPQRVDGDLPAATRSALETRIRDMGWLGGLIDPRLGGSGMSHVEWTTVIEVLASADIALATAAFTPSALIGQAIGIWGTAHQKEAYLKPLLSGISVGAAAITEPDAGTDAAHIQTTALRLNDGYVLDGSKAWITYVPDCDWVIVFARLDGDDDRSSLAAFVVERGDEGVQFQQTQGLLHGTAPPVGEIFLDSCYVPEDRRIGREGAGWEIMMRSVDVARLGCAARSVGIIKACLDMSTEYARSRLTFGQPIGRRQLVQKMITGMEIGFRTAGALVSEAAAMRDSGKQNTTRATSLAKLHAADSAMSAAIDAVQIHGAAGIHSANRVEGLMRQAKVQQIVDGTSEIHTALQALYVLGWRTDEEY